MNRTETIDFLNKNEINYSELRDGAIWVDSCPETSMSRKDSAQARKALRLIAKQSNLFLINNNEWKYNDEIEGQKVLMVELKFQDNNLDKINVDYKPKVDRQYSTEAMDIATLELVVI